MLRLLILLLVIWLLFRVWSGYRRLAGKKTPSPPAKTEKMVPCKHCGVYVPQHQAIRDGDDWFCCEAHRKEA